MPLIAAIFGMIAAVYIAASILLDEGNQLAGLFFYLLIGCGILGVLAPRLSFTLFILQCGYLDLLKRLMVIGGNISFADLFWVLGIAPVTIACIAAGLLMRLFFGQIKFGASDGRRLITAVLLNLALAAFIFIKGGGITGTLREVANVSCYALLIFIVPLLFPTPESIARCVRFIIIAFIPVAAYGIYQQVYGYQEFEIEYLKTGLSIEIKQLEANRIRSFGTLNSPTSLSVVCNSLAAMIVAMYFIRSKVAAMRMPLMAAVPLALLFLGAWLASTARAGLVLLPVALIGTVAFRHAKGVRIFYSVVIGSYIALVLLSPLILANLFIWTDTLIQFSGGSEFAQNVFNLNSYTDRLQGFINILLNPKAYTLFGIGSWEDRDNSMRGHDPISEALVTFGALPLGILLIVVFLGLRRTHGMVLNIRDPHIRAMAAAFLANAVGNIAVSIVNGNLLVTFPVNVFFWLSIAYAIALKRSDATQRVEAETPQTTPVPQALALASRGNVGRFRPVPVK